jgi:hypothetical protein
MASDEFLKPPAFSSYCCSSIHDYICGSCLGRPGKRAEDRLSDGAWAVYHELRGMVREGLVQDEQTLNMLKDLWRTAFPGTDVPSAPPDHRWKSLGFQGPNPYTDLRTGTFPLRQMVYMATHYPEVWGRLATEAGAVGHEYPLAVSMINLSFLLVMYLHLETGPASSPMHKIIRASPRLGKEWHEWR